MTQFQEIIEFFGIAIDGIGVLIVVVGALIPTIRFLLGGDLELGGSGYQLYKQRLGNAILLGLEFLVAGDIIRTVVVSPTIQNAAVLAIIVLIRTFLSMSLKVELEGRWPWQKAE
jgi:uncharacterized membrane protein